MEANVTGNVGSVVFRTDVAISVNLYDRQFFSLDINPV